MASDQWYIVKDGKNREPVSWNVLVQMARAGKLSADDQIWNESLPRWVSAGSVEGLIPSNRVSYGASPSYSQQEMRGERKSWLGGISVVMGLFFCILEMVLVAVAGVMESRPGGMPEESPEAALLGLMLLGGGAGAFFGAILGLVAMFQDNANKIAAAFGIALNGMCVIGVVLLMAIGLMMS